MVSASDFPSVPRKPVHDGWHGLMLKVAEQVAARVESEPTHGCRLRAAQQLLDSLLACLVPDCRDKDVGYILFFVHAHLAAADLEFSREGWRPLVVAAVLAATNSILGAEICESAKAKLCRSFSWSEVRASRTLAAFCARPAFRTVEADSCSSGRKLVRLLWLFSGPSAVC